MASILEKLRNTVLTDLHGLLDKKINLNKIGHLRQYVRELFDGKKVAKTEAFSAQKHVERTEGRILAVEAKMVEENDTIDLYLLNDNPADDEHAEPHQLTLMDLQEELAGLQVELEDAKKVAAGMQRASELLDAKYADMYRALRKAERQERMKNAKKKSTRALQMAESIANSDDAGDVDNIMQKIQDEADQVDSEFQATVAGMSSGTSSLDVRRAKAKALLDARRARLQKEHGEPAPAEGSTEA